MMRRAFLPFLLILLQLSRTASAHPAHADPVNYPFVVGFERFYTSLDTDDHLAKGGFLLLNELNCVACHEPPPGLKETLTGRPGTRLNGVADRFEPLDLEMMIRNPRFVKTDTIMPSFFSGPDRDLDEIEALKHFLGSLTEPVREFPDGDLERGKLLYHRVGCVSCHAPEKEYRPPWVPENIEMFLTALPSVPMNLADRYSRDSLIDLILDPVKHRPSGRMPKFPLTEEEAIDIGTYLHSTPKPELPDILRQALAKTEPFVPHPVWIARGRELFASKNCVACHRGVVDALPVPSRPLAKLRFDEPGGCLAERPPGGGVPAYGLDKLQKKAIVEALQRLGEWTLDSPSRRADWILATRNCYACHERNGVGGPESARELFFSVTHPDAAANGIWATHPPRLDGAGRKLTETWWDRILFGKGGSGRVRDFMGVRMPLYREEDLGGLVALIREMDLPEEPELGLPGGDAERGHRLIGFDGLNCVACHGIGGRPPPGVVSIDLAGTTDRLRPEYFRDFLQDPGPAVPMPDQDIDPRTAADLWAFLEKIDAFPPPDGLLPPDITEQIPTRDRPVILRTSLEGAGEDVIVVGFASGLNAVFDVEKCRWTARWKGRCLDPGPDWRSDTPVKLPLPAGVEFIGEEALWQPEEGSGRSAPVYRGYRIDEDGIPVFLYEAEKGLVHDRLDGEGRRRITIPSREESIEETWQVP